MEIPFIKMHGTGNDYIFINMWNITIRNPAWLAREMTNRHYGIGGDGVILFGPSKRADCRMQMFNKDGSEGRMCGNGIRCVARLLVTEGYTSKQKLLIETISGIYEVSLRRGRYSDVRVNMKEATIISTSDIVLTDGTQLSAREVHIGNPHAVVWVKEIRSVPIQEWGPQIENMDCFSEPVNVEFVQYISPKLLRMRVWEKGSGETLSCGTGTCACVKAALEENRCPAGERVLVEVPGGVLSVYQDREGYLHLSGPTQETYRGIWHGSEMRSL